MAAIWREGNRVPRRQENNEEIRLEQLILV
jgi:hypothetical protein